MATNGESRAREGPGSVGSGSPTRSAYSNITPAKGSAVFSVPPGAVSRRWTGCPCGCRTRLPWLDDPECIRHRPVLALDWPVYDTGTLGLQPHDRALCGACQAVGT